MDLHRAAGDRGANLTEAWGQTVVIDNRTGASGNIGVELAAKSVPDGHTLVMPITSFAVNPRLYARLPFNTEKDFAPIALVASAPLLLFDKAVSRQLC